MAWTSEQDASWTPFGEVFHYSYDMLERLDLSRLAGCVFISAINIGVKIISTNTTQKMFTWRISEEWQICFDVMIWIILIKIIIFFSLGDSHMTNNAF